MEEIRVPSHTWSTELFLPTEEHPWISSFITRSVIHESPIDHIGRRPWGPPRLAVNMRPLLQTWHPGWAGNHIASMSTLMNPVLIEQPESGPWRVQGYLRGGQVHDSYREKVKWSPEMSFGKRNDRQPGSSA
jgi:hypothetical protein